MKKVLLLGLILSSCILLTACGKKDEESTQNVESTEIIENNDCQKTIQNYLDGADKQGKGVEIKVGDNIVVDYIGRLEDGTVFETTIESIAEACGSYDENNNYTEGFSFEVGAGQKIKGFDNGVIGMKLGQTKTVKFGPQEGYGEYDKESILTAPISQFGDVSQFKEGDMVDLGMGLSAKIQKIAEKEMILDLNHELAGKNLIYDITIKAIN